MLGGKGISGRGVLDFAARAVWRIPGSFGIARLLGPSYKLRSIVFHDVSPTETRFTRGMHVNITPTDFEAALAFLVTHYTPVHLEDILDDSRDLPVRPVLVTFDDGYASAAEVAAPICKKFGVPALFFVNGAFLDNHRLAPDNLICYVANTLGLDPINAAARSLKNGNIPELRSLTDVFACLFPSISPRERQTFLNDLVRRAGFIERDLAQEAGLYMTRMQVRDLSVDFEIGSHTYSHVRCRTLLAEDFGEELDRNQIELETLSEKKVRSFSVPYGSTADLTGNVTRHLRKAGHQVVFLSESVANPRKADFFRLDRVSIHTHSDDTMFCCLEILPRLRAVRNRHFRKDACL